ADLVLPDDPAGLRLQRDDEPPAGAAEAGPIGEPLLARPAGHDDVAAGQDRRGERAVERMSIGERRRAGIELPFLFAGLAVQRIDEAAEIGKVDAIGRHQGRTHNSGGSGRVGTWAGAYRV